MSVVNCEIRVRGAVAVSVLEELEGMRVSAGSDETIMRGTLPDQSALIGVINRLQGCGVDLREIRSLGPDNDTPTPTPGTETVLRGPVPDQAALVSIIGQLQGLGIDLRGLRQLGPGEICTGAGGPAAGHPGSGVPNYEIRVAGRIGPSTATRLREFDITAPPTD